MPRKQPLTAAPPEYLVYWMDGSVRRYVKLFRLDTRASRGDAYHFLSRSEAVAVIEALPNPTRYAIEEVNK